jgi:hypothetical protein
VKKNSDLKFVSVLRVSKRGEGHEWHERIPLFCQFFFFTSKILLDPSNAPLDVEIGLHCRQLEKYIAD